MSAQRWERDGRREILRSTFDEDADAYERSRPVAPTQVFRTAFRQARLSSGSAVVEIGPGTGQATRVLAMHGLRVLALELRAQLADRARLELSEFAHIEVLTTSFEAWEPELERFDAVFACNSFHWVDPSIRFTKAAEVLRPTGHLIIVSTPWVIPTDADPFWWKVQDDWEAVGADREDPSIKHPDLIADLAPAVRESRAFEEATITRHPFRVR